MNQRKNSKKIKAKVVGYATGSYWMAWKQGLKLTQKKLQART